MKMMKATDTRMIKRRIKMAIAKLSIKQQILNIVNGRKLDETTGFLYRNVTQLRRKSNAVTVFGLFVSDGGTFMVRP